MDCDGFEVMISSDWQDKLDVIAEGYKKSGLLFPVIHADKRTGDWISDQTGSGDALLRQIWTSNCRFGMKLQAQKIVCHLWGVPDSDAHMERIEEKCGELMETARRYGLDMVAENCFCVNGSPLEHFLEFSKRYPAMGITLDTRPAQFHHELDAFLESPLLTKGSIRHIHINDYAGGYKDWGAMYPIPQPGKGNIDFDLVFDRLRKSRYAGSLTLEAPSMLPDRIDTQTLNRSLRWIREKMEGQY